MLFILSPNFSDLRRYFIGFRRFILLVLKAENTCSSPWVLCKRRYSLKKSRGI